MKLLGLLATRSVPIMCRRRTVSVSTADWQKLQSINSDFPRALNFMMLRLLGGLRGPGRNRGPSE